MDVLKRNLKKLESSDLGEVTQINLENEGLHDVTLRDYQLHGFNWLRSCFRCKFQNGCILGDEMGLGKTLQVNSVQ